MKALRLVAITLVALALGGCSYDSPPRARVVGLDEFGQLPDNRQALVIAFHEPVAPESLHVKVIRNDDTNRDAEGTFFDEDDPKLGTELTYYFSYDGPGRVYGGTADLRASASNEPNTVLVITPDALLPIGPPLAVIIEPGLSDTTGHSWKVRQVLEFSYAFACTSDNPTPTTFPSAVHFFVADVAQPIDTQLQLIGDIHVDPASGSFVGQFTNGDRDPSIDCSPYGLTCADTDACRTLPEPACVMPSERVSTADEYPDFTYNDSSDTGYSFTVVGCILDQSDGTYLFANEPASVVVPNPPVTADGIRFNAIFEYDGAGVLRGSGSFSVDEVFLGTTSFGPGQGLMQSRTIPEDEVKPGTPAPPCKPTELDTCPHS